MGYRNEMANAPDRRASMAPSHRDQIAPASAEVDSAYELAEPPLYLTSLSAQESALFSGEAPASRTVSVLCVEDDPLQQEVIEHLFELANRKNRGCIVYVVKIVASGEEALEALFKPHNLSPDLVFVDVVMEGGISGDELLLQFRRILPREVAIVMASAMSHVQLIKKCVDNGADGYLVKPLHESTVQHAWQYCYRKKKWLAQQGAEAACAQADELQRHTLHGYDGQHSLRMSGGCEPDVRDGVDSPGRANAHQHDPLADALNTGSSLGIPRVPSLQAIRVCDHLCEPDDSHENVGACQQQ